VPTASEFEILKERFEKMGIPTLIADPRELEWDGKSLIARDRRLISSTAACSSTTSWPSPPSVPRWSKPTRERGVRGK